MDKEKFCLKIRLYTDIQDKYVLVGYNIFTKNLVIYEKQMFHMPIYKTRYMKLVQRNIDIQPLKIETEDGKAEVSVDAAISWKIKEPCFENQKEEKNEKVSIINNWKHFFSTRNLKFLFLDTCLFLATSAVMFNLTPITDSIPVAVPLITYLSSAAGISFFTEYHSQKWIRKQAPVLATFQENTGVKELEQTIQSAISIYYSNKSFDEIKKKPLTMDIIKTEPEFDNIRNSLKSIEKTYGIYITGPGLTIKSADYTDESNEIKRKQAIMEMEIKQKELDTQARVQRLNNELSAIISISKSEGLPVDNIAVMVDKYLTGLAGGTIISGNAYPFINLNQQTNSTEESSKDKPKQKIK